MLKVNLHDVFEVRQEDRPRPVLLGYSFQTELPMMVWAGFEIRSNPFRP